MSERVEPSLKGQRAIVTGANSGIGEGVAKALATAGAAVVVNWVSGEDRAQQVVADIEAAGARPWPSAPTSAARTRSRPCSSRPWKPGAPSTSS